jgi:hypothetical protein
VGLVAKNPFPLLYRLPSVLASIGTIALAGLIGSRQSRLEGCIAVILTSWSYLLIHFGTEARGYSLVIFFALLAWHALQQFEERRSSIWVILFWIAVVFGFLAHLLFAVCFAGLVVWSLLRFTRNRQTWRQAGFDLFALFAVPVGLLLVFYLVALRGFVVAKGEPYRLWAVLIKTASYMVGGPGSGTVAGIIALLAVAALYVALNCLISDPDDRWIFYGVVIVAPLALIAIHRPEQLYVRYFMISVAMSLLLLSSAFAVTFRRGVAGLATVLALLALYVTGNAANTSNLLRFGRGQYLTALRFMQTHSHDKRVLVTSLFDLGTEMLVKYHKSHLERPDDLEYLDPATLKEDYARTNGLSLGAEWLICLVDDLATRPARVTDEYGNSYQLVIIYRGSDLSGSNWLLYHNLNRGSLAPQIPLVQ